MSYEAVFFWVLALVAVGSSLLVLFTRRIVHCAFWLFATLGSVAGFYLLLGADFLAFVQIMIYVGGILILILFGVMMTQTSPILFQRGKETGMLPIAAATGALVLAGVLFAVFSTRWYVEKRALEPTTQRIGELLMTKYILPFEVASVVLLVALVGAAFLARRKDVER
jgi:NADH-quinone oxidoreductase subunit J